GKVQRPAAQIERAGGAHGEHAVDGRGTDQRFGAPRRGLQIVVGRRDNVLGAAGVVDDRRGGRREGAADDERGAVAREVQRLAAQVERGGGADGEHAVDRRGASERLGTPGGGLQVVVGGARNVLGT